MRGVALSTVLLLLLPGLAQALPPDDVRHLMARAGFGPSPADFAAFERDDRRTAVRRMLEAAHTEPVTPLPEFVFAMPRPEPPGTAASVEERQARRTAIRRQARTMKGWWLQEMAETPSPLTERMVLFWHNHFVSSFAKVRDPDLMMRQNLTLRRHALGNFRDLLHAVAADPAMMRYLDTVTNRRLGPNENFARELLELFTLGEGHYSERDVREAARAFTGWGIDRHTGTFRLAAARADTGPKTIFGRTDRFDGHAVLDLVLARPEVAPLVLGKLWRELVSGEPDERALAPIAARFARDWNIAEAVRAMLDTPAFWEPGNRARLIKSPADLVVGTVRLVGRSGAEWEALAMRLRRLGQDLFQPPNVRGWPGGATWIDTDSLVMRRELLDRMARGQGLVAAASALSGITPDGNIEPLVLATAAVDPLPGPPDSRLAAMLRDPAFQLK
ncbi:hypothetical protein STAQ_29230 [Allostella sp. ATCC 35155]|nr:hypothetical protein STAQ_29230 [Stella sp. ATCC 35155]